MFNNQKKPLQIKRFGEFFILSFPFLLLMTIILCLGLVHLLFTSGEHSLVSFSMCHVLIVLLPNILLFSVLRNKLDMEIETFLYGIGFLSNIALLYFFTGENGKLSAHAFEEYILSLFLIILLFALLYYTYAAVLKIDERKGVKFILFLLVITIFFCIVGMVKTFEIFKLEETRILALLQCSIGLYAGHCAVYKTPRISLRNIAWTSFLTLFIFTVISLISILSFLSILFMRAFDTLPIAAAVIFTYIPVSFVISYLIGTVCKRCQKKQSLVQTNE
ncbi:MAG: hypothetical protein LBU81_03600 [Methanosarcinales archaeon]|jgi:hypothetical protein|nr:hypothetical protein [Methanosarcinales archaeon]